MQARFLRLIAAALMFASFAAAQVSVLFTPQSMRAARTLGIRDVGLWTLRACNDGTSTVTLPEERIYMAAPSLSVLDRAAALAILQHSHARDRRVLAARLLEDGIALSSIFAAGGLISATPRVIIGLSLGATAAHNLASIFEGQVPDLNQFQSTLLEGTLALQPHGCATRTVLASIHKSPAPVFTRIP